jgi:two-component system, cell cycle sensor histidine kinase PleC
MLRRQSSGSLLWFGANKVKSKERCCLKQNIKRTKTISPTCTLQVLDEWIRTALSLYLAALGGVDSRARFPIMPLANEHTERASGERASGHWPIAVTLVLCVLFAAVISLLVKREYDSYKSDATQKIALEARIVAEHIDTAMLSARTSLMVLAGSNLGAASSLTVTSNLEAIAVFDPTGRIAVQSISDPADLGPLAAAAQLGTSEGWTGAVARGDGVFTPAVSIRTADGGAVAAFVVLPPEPAIGQGRRIVITEATGAIVSAVPAFKTRPSGAPEAYNTRPADKAAGPSGIFTQGPDGEKVVLGSAVSASGLVAYVVQDRGPIDMAWYRTGIMFALLFLGPLLAAAGIYFIVRGQNERFANARTQMRDAERRLRIAIEGANCGVWDWDISEDRVYLTQRLARTFGLEGAGRFETAEVLEALGQEDGARLRAALSAAAQIGSLDVVLQVINKAGISHVHLRGRAAADRNNPGKIRAIGVSIDVSEERNTEARVTAAERRLRDAIDSVSGPFALWSKDHKLILWNGGFAKTFGLDVSVLRAGASYKDVSAAAAKHVKSQRPDRYDELAQEIELDNGVWIQLVERPTSEGGLVSIGVDISPLKETEENILKSERQMRAIVTELERSEQQAAELAAKYNSERMRAEEASSAKSGFLANMSHELRTPLNAINGFSEIMVQQLYGPMGDKRYHSYATDILESGRHLLELINGVLDMAKVEAGKFKIYPKPMDLEETISQAIRLVRGRAEEKAILIETDIGDIGDIIGDTRAVKQIMINLLSNAVKFTPNSGRVLVQVRSSEADVTIRVIDTGIGIPAQHLPRLARPFEQVENEHAKANQGTGLGLALCRSFAEMHGGTLTITSEQGVGTMVSVKLPREAVILEQQEAA